MRVLKHFWIEYLIAHPKCPQFQSLFCCCLFCFLSFLGTQFCISSRCQFNIFLLLPAHGIVEQIFKYITKYAWLMAVSENCRFMLIRGLANLLLGKYLNMEVADDLLLESINVWAWTTRVIGDKIRSRLAEWVSLGEDEEEILAAVTPLTHSGLSNILPISVVRGGFLFLQQTTSLTHVVCLSCGWNGT